jgi:cyclic beta-1,2-glucan synthetase
MGTLAHRTVAPDARAHPGTPGAGGRLLGNGRYSVLLTHAGGGASWCGEHLLTRWSPDRIEDRSGLALYVRDLATGRFASVGLEPAGADADRYESRWEPGVSVIERSGDALELRLEVCVLPDADAELRRITVTNRASFSRRIELTSAGEIVLHHARADAAHPAFSKLFVQTEFVPTHAALIARRRPRGADESHPLLLHALPGAGAIECESDRLRFLGRDGNAADPAMLRRDAPPMGTIGNVLDPIASLRCVLELAGGESAVRTFVLAAGTDRTALLSLTRRFESPHAVEEGFAAARAHAKHSLEQCGVAPGRAAGLQALAAALCYGHPLLRAMPGAMLGMDSRAVPLVPLGARLPRPLVLVHARAVKQLPALDAARRYWATLGVPTDVVVLPGSRGETSTPEGMRVLSREEASAEAVATLSTAASLVLDRVPLEPLAEAILVGERGARPSRNGRAGAAANAPAHEPARPRETLREWNGHGGFSADGREYVIRMPWLDGRLQRPTCPWVNVIATPEFGFIASETGAGSTWAANSREHRLTPWSNDPVLDPHGEAVYLRDEESGAWWSPLPGPAPQACEQEMRHGFGYSIARHRADGLEQEVTLFALIDQPMKVTRVRVTNHGARPRRLSFWAYQRLVLGVLPEESARFVVTADDVESELLLATNPAAGVFADRVTFAASVAPDSASGREVSGDRETFLGGGGSPARPLALAGGTLDARFGAGLDPCFAEKRLLEVAPGASVEVAFLLGACVGADAAHALVERMRHPGAVARALADVIAFWRDLVSGVQLESPEPALDLMVNGWLAYQTLSCRIWGRSAFYQSGGAFGFRDQLQDAASLLHLSPALAREQLVLHASHQFVEGDVLHWWHPPDSRGIRTRFADDLLWLPLLAAYYVGATGDRGVLEERARFLAGPLLEPGEDERFIVPTDSGESADVYEHCCRAIDRSLILGSRGLPLFGTGDWNDGMNRVGREGRGESVWMGFFLFKILGDFVPFCERRGDEERVERYHAFREALRGAVNDAGWDGEWYRRAYYDDGAPMGSRTSDECRIDGLAQAWAVISGAAPPERAAMAMEAARRELVSERDGLIRLLTPPFQDTPHDPGYIKGYVPGVRENGGQYTHAALWLVRAFAELEEHKLAARLLTMLSPVSHTRDRERLARYRTEPYVIAADVYGEPPHVGRGGWTWYTGSAGWMLRVALESLLGITAAAGEHLRIRPVTPGAWREFRVRYREPRTRATYMIIVRAPGGDPRAVRRATLDGQPVAVQGGTTVIPLAADSATHKVEIELGGEDA